MLGSVLGKEGPLHALCNVRRSSGSQVARAYETERRPVKVELCYTTDPGIGPAGAGKLFPPNWNATA